MKSNIVRRSTARNLARACAAVSAAMLVATAWVAADIEISPADAAVTAGEALVIVPRDGRPDAGTQIDAGDADTEFSLRLPDGASCPGDSANDGYRVTSYIIASTMDPSTLVFGSEGPEPQQFGPPQESFASPLHDTTASPYILAMTANASPPPGPGSIINIPAFSFAVFGEPGSGYEIPAGEYNVGIACFVPAVGGGAVESYWNTEMTFTEVAGPPAATEWSVVQDTITQTRLAMDPFGAAALGEPVTLTATVDPPEAAGTVSFSDAGSPIGDPLIVTDGVAELERSDLPAGTREFTATFTPTAEGFVGSTSDPVNYEIAGGEATETTLTAAPATEAAVGDTVTLTATVEPDTAMGNVTFLDAGSSLGDTPVEAGGATLAVSDLAPGTHTLTARFVPAAGTGLVESTSSELSYTITGAAATVTLVADPANEANVGDEVDLTASIEPDDAEGDIVYKSGTVPLGTIAIVDGKASLTLDDLEIGSHSLTATYEPDEASSLEPVTSTAVTYEILAAPTTTTTTTTTTTSPTTTTTDPTTTTTEVPSTTTVPPSDAPSGDPGVGGGSVTTGSGMLPVTGGSLSMAFWAALLVVSGRVAVLLGRTPSVRVR